MSAGRLAQLASAICAPAGSGWGSSSAGDSPLSAQLHHAWYGTTVRDLVAAEHRAQLADVDADSGGAVLLGVPFASACYGPNGSRAGPVGIRLAGLQAEPGGRWLAAAVHDLGDIRYFPGLGFDDDLASKSLERARRARGVGDSIPISMVSAAGVIARAARAEGRALLTLGGDHSVTAATAGAYVGGPVGLVYFDQHADRSAGRDGLRTLHNSWVTRVVAEQSPPIVVQVGGLDEAPGPSWARTRFAGIDAASVHRDVSRAAAACLDSLGEAGCSAIYVSIDIDVMDRSVAPATGLPATGGLSLHEIERFLQLISVGPRMVAADLMEVGPPVVDATVEVDVTCRTAAKLVGFLAQAVAR